MASVLVVDDEFGVAEVLQAILEDEGHRVSTAIHGRAALEQMAEERPDLVLSDYVMPLMDGAALLAAMAQDRSLASIPVVMMSSLPEASIAERFGGYTAFMRKPFRVTDVISLLEKILGSRT